MEPGNENFACNCRKKESLDNKWLTPSIIYQAQITNNTNDEYKKYLGAAETLLKERYSNHIGHFKPKKYMKCTELKVNIRK